MQPQWFVTWDANETGPISTDRLKQLADNGMLKPSDSVRQENQTKKVPASSIAGLFRKSPKRGQVVRPPPPPRKVVVAATTGMAKTSSPPTTNGARSIRSITIADRDGNTLCVVPGATLRGANLTGRNLRKAKLLDLDLTDAILTGADLSDASIEKCNFTRANLVGAILTHASIDSSNFSAAKLHQANLASARISSSRFWHAILGKADCRRTRFYSGTDLRGANLRDTQFEGARYDSHTSFGDLRPSRYGMRCVNDGFEKIAEWFADTVERWQEGIDKKTQRTRDLERYAFSGPEADKRYSDYETVDSTDLPVEVNTAGATTFWTLLWAPFGFAGRAIREMIKGVLVGGIGGAIIGAVFGTPEAAVGLAFMGAFLLGFGGLITGGFFKD